MQEKVKWHWFMLINGVKFPIIAFFVFIIFSTTTVYTQALYPNITNHIPLEYNGEGKNWGVSLNDKGELFVANDQGLIYHNGEKWQLYKLPNQTVLRSVVCHGNRIYTGSYEEIGYWEKNSKGELNYHSLTHLINNHTFSNEEFWEILIWGDKICFRSFASVFIYHQEKIQVIEPNMVVSDFVVYNNDFIIAGNRGLFKLVNNTLVSILNNDALETITINDMLVLNDSLLVGTKRNGCYVYQNQTLTSWNTQINTELKQHQLNKLIDLGNHLIGIGTIRNGFYVYNTLTNSTKIFNRNSGLQNNTILSVATFGERLWLGLDNGLSSIEYKSAIRYFTDLKGELGTVYDLAFYKGTLFLGSNTGVYYLENDKLTFIEGSQGHVWDLEVVENDLLCGHNTGTYRVSKNKFDIISPISGGYKIEPVPNQKNTYIQGTYNGLVKLSKQPNTDFWKSQKIKGLDFPIKYLCFEQKNTLWVAHPYKGFAQIVLNKSNDSVTTINRFDIPNAFNVKLFNVKNQILISGQGKWYKFDPIHNKITSFDTFEHQKSYDFLGNDKDYFWFTKNYEQKSLLRTNLKNDSLILNDQPFNERLVPAATKLIQPTDSTVFVTLSQGFAKINLNDLKDYFDKHPPVTPQINTFSDEKTGYSLDANEINIPYKTSQSIIIEVSAPQTIRPTYNYVLTGPKSYEQNIRNGHILFQNLPFGTYNFSIRTNNVLGEKSEFKTLKFNILRPWFLSLPMLLVYTTFAALIWFVIHRYNRKKIARKQTQLKTIMQREHTQRLAQFEKEQLKKEIKKKQTELTGTTLNIAKKNELIIDARDLIATNKNKIGDSQRTNVLVKKLTNAIKDTNDWKQFELNFKELHNDFFERILIEFPDLTPKDLKLCAYLKMTLSTKEIAPLMAISIRGVEIHRYRLRKKLKLSKAEGLTKFLISY